MRPSKAIKALDIKPGHGRSLSRRESGRRATRDPSTLRNRTAEQIVRVFPSHDSRSER